jgi:hypothetical protein
VNTLDLVTLTPPPGWTVEERAAGILKHAVLVRRIGSSYCMIVLYSSTPASTSLEASFAAEWTSVALRTIDAVPTPTPEIRTVGNARAAVGAALSQAQGQPVMGMLIVLDAGASVVSMLVLSPSAAAYEAYTSEVQAMLAGLIVRPVGAPSPPAVTGGAPLVVPPPARTLLVTDLAGEWGRNDGITTTYVDRYTGSYAGTDSLHFTEAWVIGANGTISLDFHGLQNGRRILEKDTGTVTLSADRVLTIRMTNEQLYLLRGWLEGPEMTVMTLNGPWYADGIPAAILTNPEYGVNQDKRWVRLRRK